MDQKTPDKVSRDELPPTDLKYDRDFYKKLAKKVKKQKGKAVTPWECYVTVVCGLKEVRTQLATQNIQCPESDTELQKFLIAHQRRQT